MQGVQKERARGEVRVSEAHFTAARSFFNLFLALLTLLPSLAHTQTDSTTLHGTNAEWADRTWLRLLDRGAAADGRLTDKGILLRFHENIDEEYWLDFISTGPSITENYEWWQNQNGARYSGGSVNHLRTLGAGDFKAGVSLGRGWLIRALFTLEDYEELTRALTRFNVEKSWSGGLYAFGETTLLSQKPEIDVTLGVGYRKSKLDAALSLTALDFFNDMIFEGLVVDSSFSDTAVAYATFPWALRGKLHWDPVSQLRFEGDAAYVISSRFSAFRQASPDSGFVQSEDFAFVGLLGEYSFSPRLRAGAFLHYAFAETDRAPLSNGDPTMDYVLTEKTTRAGGYVLRPRWV